MSGLVEQLSAAVWAAEQQGMPPSVQLRQVADAKAREASTLLAQADAAAPLLARLMARARGVEAEAAAYARAAELLEQQGL